MLKQRDRECRLTEFACEAVHSVQMQQECTNDDDPREQLCE